MGASKGYPQVELRAPEPGEQNKKRLKRERQKSQKTQEQINEKYVS